MLDVDARELHRNPVALRGSRLLVDETPKWVERRTVRNSSRQDGHPITLLLLDRQIHADEKIRYTRWVRRLETPQAVQDAGRIELDFDPATQKLIVHAISIFRNGELKNFANLDDIDVIQRERDLEQGIYDGSMTALVLLKDVRTADVIDIEFSLISDRPIFPDHYWFIENFEHTLPVAQQHLSWLSQNIDRFQIRKTSEAAEEREEETEWGARKTWSRDMADALDVPEILPIGYNPFKTVSLCSFSGWHEVAQAYEILWEGKHEAPADLLAEIHQLRDGHEGGSDELVMKLAAFVRDTIRYQGVEVGLMGQVPEDLETIWERRYGDCKEKTNMLCWCLRECGFEATPALVSTSMGGRVEEILPCPAFDHVVVHLAYQDKDYWIDPTSVSQRGHMETWNSLPFEKALLISQDTTELISIAPAPPKQDFLDVKERYEFVGDTAKIQVTHNYHGTEANRVRHALDSNGRPAAQKYFSELVSSTRPRAELDSDLQVSDDPDANVLTMSASFSAPRAIERGGQGGRKGCEFVPHSIIGKIVGLGDAPRAHPLGLLYPLEVYHSIEVAHPDAQNSVFPKTIINNEFLSFNAGTRKVGKNTELFYEYRNLAQEIDEKCFERYRLNLKQISGAISLVFEPRQQAGRDQGSWDDGEYGNGSDSGRRRVRHSVAEPRGSGIPIWLIVFVVAVIVRVLLWAMRE